MIQSIYEKLQEYLVGQDDVAVEIRMHPSVYNDCMNCDCHEVSSAFSLSPTSAAYSSTAPPTTMFNERLVIDFDLDEGECRVQSPRY